MTPAQAARFPAGGLVAESPAADDAAVGRAARVVIALAVTLLALFTFASASASADTRHPSQSLEFGIDGSAGTKFNDQIYSLAYDQRHNRLWVFGRQGETARLYSFENPSSGVFTPRPGFPVTIKLFTYDRPRILVDDSDGPTSGRVYVVTNAQGEESIHAYEPDGSEVLVNWPLSGFGSGSFFPYPCDADVDPQGNVWLPVYNEKLINTYSSGGIQVGEMPITGEGGPCRIAFDRQSGDFYLQNDITTGEVRRYDADTDYLTNSAPFGSDVFDLAFDGTGDRLYASRSYSKPGDGFVWDVGAYTPDGELIELFGQVPGGYEARYTGVAVNEDNGDVMIADVNGQGQVHVYPSVTVPNVTTGEQIGNDGVSGSIDRAGAGEITDCYFEYATEEYFEDNGGTYDGQVPCEPTAPFDEDRGVTATVPGLENETVYRYRLVAGNADGLGNGVSRRLEPHDIDSLRTEPASAIDRESVTLNASFVGNGEDTTYRFQWGEDAVDENESSPTSVTAPVGQTDVSLPITGLHAGTTYSARVIAERGPDESIANVITFTTAPAVKDVETGAATDISPTAATLNGALDPDGNDTTYYFEWGKTKLYGQTTPAAPGDAVGTSAPGQTPVSTELTDLEPGATYHFRLVGVNSFDETTGPDEVFTTPQAPSIDGFSSRNVTATTAELTGQIDPNGLPTTAYFEYGTTLEYGSIAPVPESQLEALDGPQQVVVPIEGLAGVTYHFRLVAENQWGEVRTEDQSFDFNAPAGCPNHTVRQQTGAAYLPDCRAYELVSARRAGGAILAPMGPTSPYASSPARFAYVGTINAIPGTGEPINAAEGDLYVASRSVDGWTTRYTGLPGYRTLGFSGPRSILDTSRVSTVITDTLMSRFMLWDRRDDGFAIGPEGEGTEIPYVYDNVGNEVMQLPTNFDEVPGSQLDIEDGGWVGVGKPSADFSHYFFSTQDLAFETDGRTTAPGSVYDNDIAADTVVVVSKTEAGQDIPRDVAGPPNEYIRIPAVSTDGSHVLMSTVAAGGLTHLYMAVNDGSGYDHYDISRDEGGANHGATFAGMTDDGSTVFFTSDAQLTDDDTDSLADLYRWDEAGNEITRVSSGSGESGNAAQCGFLSCGVELLNVHTYPAVNGFHRVSNSDTTFARESGDYYFISAEQLDGARGVVGKRNLYLQRADGTVQFVATFERSNLPIRMNVSPDGSHMAMISSARLTSFDNLGYDQMYTYDADARRILCVSCPGSGAPPANDVEGSQNGLFMTADGRPFFSTKDALVPRDANGINDVYEYVNGRAQLISTGTGDNEGGERLFKTGLVGVSLDGTDVFFSTFSTLVPEDENGAFMKFYDARTNGGFLYRRPPAPCVAADECHGPESPAPVQPVIGTRAALGDGNARTPAKKRRPRCAVKKRRRGKGAARKRAARASKVSRRKAQRRGAGTCKKRSNARKRRGGGRG